MLRLTARRDYLAVAKGARLTRAPFTLECLKHDDAGAARFGFTVSKRIAAKAVERNRIRRRLKEAARRIAPDIPVGADYVVIGRRPALQAPFAALVAELDKACAAAFAAKPRGGRTRPKRKRNGE